MMDHIAGIGIRHAHGALYCLLALSGLFSLAALAHAAVPTGYTLAWSEEFNQAAGSKPDPARWSYDLGASGWGNNEWENYVSDAEHCQVVEDAAADGGLALQIKATKDASGKYYSARIKTVNKYTVQYGYLEGRIRMSYGQGIWPAFWMLGTDFGTAGWPTCGEIDIMENIGSELSIAHGTLHGPGYSGGNGLGAGYTLPGGAQLKDGYHTFAVRWRPDAITFYVDGNAYFTRTAANVPSGSAWVFNHPFFFILNLAVGGNWPGYPNASTVFPQTLRVDYVRVYKFVPPIRHTVSLKSLANSKFVTAGGTSLIASQASAGPSEQFQVVDAGSGYVALKALANGLYVTAASGTSGPLTAGKAAIGNTEKFQWVDAGSGNVALKALANNQYVTADNAGANPLIANRATASTWETFAVTVAAPTDAGVLADAAAALSAGGGINQPSPFVAGWLNVEQTGDSAVASDLLDSVRLARQANGLDSF